MPNYTYKCSNCGEREFYQSMYETKFTACPDCESEDFKRLINKPGIKFNGSGFYSTDNRGK